MSSGIELRHRVVELLVLVLMSSALTTALSNPCFSDYSSLTCLGHIAKQRAITYASAAQLRNRALQLYENEQSSPSAVYDALTLAVACLAYPGTWKPGPDSDCTMCLPSHIHQSPQEVCDLYCVPSAITKTTVADIKASHADITTLTTALSNPCFFNYSSQKCLDHIAKQRAITYASAAQLRNRALQLYENEQSSPSAVYDALTLAVACLAYPGTWKPGPDSDCTMCLPSHIHQSPQEVCDLYCVPSAITKTTVTDIEASLADITENNKCTSILTTKLAVFIGAAIFILVILLPVGLLITYILYKICKTCHRDKGDTTREIESLPLQGLQQ